jgi:hypothetical protein
MFICCMLSETVDETTRKDRRGEQGRISYQLRQRGWRAALPREAVLESGRWHDRVTCSWLIEANIDPQEHEA